METVDQDIVIPAIPTSYSALLWWFYLPMEENNRLLEKYGSGLTVEKLVEIYINEIK